MADKNDKHPLNADGRYYCALTRIDCGLCTELVPGIFARDDSEGLAYVWKQPVTGDEITAAEEALEACPVEAIGKGG